MESNRVCSVRTLERRSMVLTQSDAKYLIEVLKVIKSGEIITFPSPGEQTVLEAQSDELSSDKFLFYINRKGQYNLKKCTYVSRYNNVYNLLRVDINGPPHDNPDGTTVHCPHIHIYKEGYNLSWAYPLEVEIKTDPKDLIMVLIDFLKYNNLKDISGLSIQDGGLV